MKRLYQAKDGVIFETQQDCEDYESSKVLFLTPEGDSTSYSQAKFAFVRDTSQCQFFEKCVKEHKDKIEEYCSILPGLYFRKPYIIGKKSIWEFEASVNVIQAIKDKGLLV